MKLNAIKILFIVVVVGIGGSQSQRTMPPMLRSVAEAKAILPGKIWVLKDVGFITSRSGTKKNVPMVIN